MKKPCLNNPKILKQLELGGFTKTYSGLGNWIIREFLVNNTGFRFEHLNLRENFITIIDNKIRRIADVYVMAKGENTFELYCDPCNSDDCEHVKYALSVEDFMLLLKNRGLKYAKTR